ncbi:MAG TPA: hypothetical protein VK747_18515 [Blastocatellia bacterium]|nr:hypothetical protein [Blastocatellia bacterium]
MKMVKVHGDAPTAAKGGNSNNSKTRKRPRPRNPVAPQLPEETKKLTLKAFRLAYEAHHGKSS